MSETTVNLGMLPNNRGSYTSETWTQNPPTIYKDNIVEFNNSAYIYSPVSFSIDNPAASATTNPPYDAATPTVLNTGWYVFASGNNKFTTGEGVDNVGIDSEPVAGSNNLVKSKGVYKEVDKVYLQTVNSVVKFTLENGHYISQSGNYYSSSDQNLCATEEYYPIYAGIEYKLYTYAPGSADVCAFYDKDKNFVSYFTAFSLPKIIQFEQDGFIRISNESNHYSNDNCRMEAVFDTKTIKELEEEINNIPSEVDEIFDSKVDTLINELKRTINIQYTIVEVSQGLINKTTNAISYSTGDYPNYRYSKKYYQVTPGSRIIATAESSGNFSGVIFYDNNKNIVGSIGDSPARNSVIDVPSNAYYVRLCTEKYNTYGLALCAVTVDNEFPIKNSAVEASNGMVFNLESSIFKHIRVDYDLSNLLTGYFLYDGRLVTDGVAERNKYCPDYINVIPGSTIFTNGVTSGSVRRIVFYKKDKSFLSAVAGTSSTTGTLVPNDAYYARFCTEYYNSQIQFWAYKGKDIVDPEFSELKENVGAIDESIKFKNECNKKCFSINQTGWIADETPETFSPNSPKIEHNYVGQVSPRKRFIAIGFDDFSNPDFSFIIPLFEKYCFRAEFNRVHNTIAVNEEDKQKVNSVINGRHELGDHCWRHQNYPFFEPLFNGQNPDNPDGSQVAFPTNSQLTADVGDGKNIFGIPLTNNVKTDIGAAPDETVLDKTWGELTSSDCQYFREYFSVMKDTVLCPILDTLSNKYLGTTGNSSGSWDSVSEKYTGGIFTDCKTSQNHEIWERMLYVTNMYFKDVFRLNFDFITWSYPGSKTSKCRFIYDGKTWYDEAHTKRYGNLARFTSSMYVNQDGTYKQRSLTEVLREFKYKTTHDTRPTSSSFCSLYQFILNANNKRIDALPHSTNRALNYETIRTEYTKGVDLTGTEPLEIQMYNSTNSSVRKAIEEWRRWTANGVIWGEVIDSQDTWSERMILECLLKYAKASGIELITKAEAFDICFNHQVYEGNLLYNPTFRNTAKEFMPSNNSVPTNPDGFTGNCSVSVVDNIPILVAGTGNTIYRHFGIPIGKIRFSADVKGSGTISIFEIKNNSIANNINTGDWTGLNSLASITITDDTQFISKSADFTTIDYPVEEYEQVFEGYGNKTIGVMIVISSGLQVKNMDMRLV